jgi:hypothetical protein
MTSAWFDLPPGERLPQHDWYKHLGRGENIRTADLPLRLTRAMAHWFTQAPHHYSAIVEVRWAQVRGLGGSKALARAVILPRSECASVTSVWCWHYNRPFADQWEFVEYVHQQKLNLDLTTPPERPVIGR